MIIPKVTNKMNSFLIFVLGIMTLMVLPKNSLSGQLAIYGGYDDREQYYEIENDARLQPSEIPYYKELATSVCLITYKSNIAVSGDGKSKMYLSNTLYNRILQDYDSIGLKKVCDSTKYKEEYIIAPSGTGTLINDNSIVTAHHVVAAMIFRGPVVCIFNYFKAKKSDFQVKFENPTTKTKPYVLIDTTDIYNVTNTSVELIKGNATSPYDFAVLTLSKNAAGKQRRMCFYSDNDIMSQIGVYGKELFTWGFPFGLPMKFVDDAHLTRSDSFRVDMDLYSGNSGSPIFAKINPGNFQSLKYKVLGVESSGEYDYKAVMAPANGVNCNCWIDNAITPGTPTPYETISFIDQITWVSGVQNNSCSTIPWQKPPADTVSPARQKTLGEKPVIKFTANINGTFMLRLYYQADGSQFQLFSKTGCLKNNTYNVTMDWVPAGVNYNYKIFDPNGGELTSFRGSSTAKALVLGSLDYRNQVTAMVYVGNGPKYPYKTLQEAITNAPSGYTLHLARGDYNETVTITKPLTIIGDDNGAAMITSNGTSPAITIQSNNVSIENVYFQNSGFSGTAISLTNASGCIIKNSYFSGYSPAIVLKNGCTRDTVTGNFLWGASTVFGIEVNASTGNTLTNNVVDFGRDIFNFIGCISANNTVSGNVITTKTPPPDTIPPSVPGLYWAQQSTDSSAYMGWSLSTDNIGMAKYDIEYKVGASGTYSVFASVDSASKNYMANGLKMNVNYCFRIRAFDMAGNSSVTPENCVTITDQTKPTKPGKPTLTVISESQINVSWLPVTDNIGVTSYRICCGTGASSTWNTIGTVNGSTTTFSATGLLPSTLYHFQIVAGDAAGNEAFGSPNDATTPDTHAPSAPGQPTFNVRGLNIDLTWTPSTDNVGVSSYKIEYKAASDANYSLLANVSGSTTTYSTGTLANGTTYSFRITAYDAAGNASAVSAEASTTTVNVAAVLNIINNMLLRKR